MFGCEAIAVGLVKASQWMSAHVSNASFSSQELLLWMLTTHSIAFVWFMPAATSSLDSVAYRLGFVTDANEVVLWHRHRGATENMRRAGSDLCS